MHGMSEGKEGQDKEHLIISKNSSQDMIYYYNREQRLDKLKLKGKNQRRGIFRKNSILLILIVDILIICIIFLFIRWSKWGDDSRMTFSGYSIKLGAYWIKDRIFAKLEITEGNKEPVQTRMNGTVRFYQKDGNYCEKPFIFPSRNQNSTEIACSFLSKAVGNTVFADISIGNITKRLSMKPNER
jgi:hypothetical protein